MKRLFIFSALLSQWFAYSQTLELEVIRQINQIRIQLGGPTKGLSQFSRSTGLDLAAAHHAKWLVKSKINSHIETLSVDGLNTLSTFTDRAYSYNSIAFAENFILYSRYIKRNGSVDIKSTAEAVVNSWVHSPNHYAALTFTMPKTIEAQIGVFIVPHNEYEFCIVMLVGANLTREELANN